MDLPDAEEQGGGNKTLNRAVAVTVVVLSVSMALVNIKDGNIVQNMQAAQALELDKWNQYQATRLKLKMEEIVVDAGGVRVDLAREQVAKYTKSSAELMEEAHAAKAVYDANSYRDDQFDLSDGLASMALAVTAIAALVEVWGLLYFSWGAGALSLVFAIAGFAQLPFHPDRLIGFLT
jgi:hypothetical protein